MTFADNWGVNAETALGVLLIGLGIGFLSGAFGKGGSAIATPLLHLAGVPAMVAVASPLPATIPSTFVASRAYAREGHVDTRVLRLGIAIGLPATVIGALMTRWIAGTTLVLATDAIVLMLGLRFLLGHDHETAPAAVTPSAPRVLAVAAVVGVVSGLLGNSGGFLLAPLFIAVLGMPVRRALGTSLALAGLLAIPGTIVHAWLGHINWSVTAVFALGAIPLALFGARAALHIKERALTLAYGAGLAFVAGGLLLFAR
jgi:uncharacterized membrane protein YfcA